MPNTVKELIDFRAEQADDRTFVYCPEQRSELSFARLRDKALELDRKLSLRGIGTDTTVAFLMDNGYYTTGLFLGLMYSGRIALPLNAVAGHDALSFVIEHSETRIIFVSRKYLAEYSKLFQSLGEGVEIVICDEDTGPEFGDPEFSTATTSAESLPAKVPTTDDTALLIYTSGTTGRPKGVLLSHKNVIAGGRNTTVAHKLTERDRGLCVLPLYHINAEMVSVMAPLVSGGSIVLPHRFSVKQFWQWITDYRCTWFSIVPTIVSYLIDHMQREPDSLDLERIKQHVRFGRSASAALPAATHQRFEALFNIPIAETMGISEAAAQILSNPMTPGANKYGSPGQAIGNEVKIVDSQNKELSRGERGEIVIRGDNIMQGYLKNPQETAKAIDDQGWLHSGDIGYMDEEGFVFVTGRIKELIIKGGENISPREIDEVLYRHPEVLEAAAFGVPDERYGQEVMACVVLRPEADCSLDALKKYCTEQLGDYKAPREIRLAEELPKGPSGKIQRLKMAELFNSL